jgi:hypothetical protein
MFTGRSNGGACKKRILVGSINMSPLWGFNHFNDAFLLRCRPSGAFNHFMLTFLLECCPSGGSMLYLHLAYIKIAMPL